jgi:hypothetical protein
MKVDDLIKRLENLLEKERDLLLKFPISDADQFIKIQEEIKETLYKLSQFPKEELMDKTDELINISKLNSSISSLLINQLSFLEELEREIFGESLTYSEKAKNSLFNRKA